MQHLVDCVVMPSKFLHSALCAHDRQVHDVKSGAVMDIKLSYHVMLTCDAQPGPECLAAKCS